MEVIERGVVLCEQCAVTPTIAVFTQNYGRLSVRDRRTNRRIRLQQGQGVRLVLQHEKGHWFIKEAEFLLLPVGHDHATLFWLHHFFELYYYFLPLEQASNELFVHLCTLVRVESAPLSFWQVGVARFFQFLGYGLPQELAIDVASFDKQVEPAARNLAANVLHLNEQKEYHCEPVKREQWIARAVRSHPHASLLKTTTFFTQLYPHSEVGL